MNKKTHLDSVIRFVGLFVFSGFLAAVNSLYAQDFATLLSVRGIYLTGSTLYPFPNTTVPELRRQTIEVDHIGGALASVRFLHVEDLYAFSINAGYLHSASTSDENIILGGATRTLPLTEGVRVTSVELQAEIILPFDLESFRFSIGGGAGVYRMERILGIAGNQAQDEKSGVAASLIISSTVEYRLTRSLWLTSEMSFRNPEVKVKNQFERSTVIYKGEPIYFPISPFETRVELDGIQFSAGLSYLL